MTEDEKTTKSKPLVSRDSYFAHVDLTTSDIFCGDDRPPIDTLEPYIHIFGGALFVPYNLIVLQAVREPDKPLPAFSAKVGEIVVELRHEGVQGLGVHSDEHTEGSDHFQFEHADGKVGCGYGELRATISDLIAKRGAEILNTAAQLFPKLVESAADREFGEQVIAAHGRLSGQPTILGKGREVVRAGVQAGAKSMVVAGDHAAKKGIINTQESSSAKTGEAYRNDDPFYDHDLWASQELFERLNTSYDSRQFKLASAIDVIGTMLALGVEEIAGR